tara:strand:+ start:1430 stop:1543 length:114 start_codon:yes stop_codon:yes gene_type:complete
MRLDLSDRISLPETLRPVKAVYEAIGPSQGVMSMDLG